MRDEKLQSDARSLSELVALLDRRQYDPACKVTLNGDEYRHLRDAALAPLSATGERPSDRWNEAIDAAAAIADREWVGENSLLASRVARKIADCIRDLRSTDNCSSQQEKP